MWCHRRCRPPLASTSSRIRVPLPRLLSLRFCTRSKAGQSWQCRRCSGTPKHRHLQGQWSGRQGRDQAQGFLIKREIIRNSKKSIDLPGSAVTPTLDATSSPNDLVMARPGMSSFFNHTLRGPIGFLSWSLKESILPPYLMILAASSAWHGFWSLDMAWAISLPATSPCFFLTTIPLESPTFEQNSFWPRVRTVTQVEPLNLISMIPENSSSLQFKNALLKAIQISSVFKASSFWFFYKSSVYFLSMNRIWASKYYGSFCLRNWLTFSPCWPWPSATEKKWQYFSPQKWGTVIHISWFTLFGLLGDNPVFVANANLVTAFVYICFGLLE